MLQTILVIDDSPTVVKFVSFSLRTQGYNVMTACDGMDAIEKLSATGTDVALIITDLNMPNLDGFSLIRTLRESERHARTPIVILTSQDGEDDRDRGLKVGANSYLVKPFKSAALLEEVVRQLQTNATVK